MDASLIYRGLQASILDWVKALASLGPLVLGIAVFVATKKFQDWQVRLGRQQLRQDLYDRRFAIYAAFRDLLIALPEKTEGEIKGLFRLAEVAEMEARFLLGDCEVKAYLKELRDEIGKDVIKPMVVGESCTGNDPDSVKLRINSIAQLGAARLSILERGHLQKLGKRFESVLDLADFWENARGSRTVKQ